MSIENVIYWTDQKTGSCHYMKSAEVKDMVAYVVETVGGIKTIDCTSGYTAASDKIIYGVGSVSFGIDVCNQVDFIINGKYFMRFFGKVRDFWELINEQLYVVDGPVYDQGVIG